MKNSDFQVKRFHGNFAIDYINASQRLVSLLNILSMQQLSYYFYNLYNTNLIHNTRDVNVAGRFLNDTSIIWKEEWG